MCNGNVVDWLLEDSNPGVKHRAMVELLGASCHVSGEDRQNLFGWLKQLKDASWQIGANGLWLTYNLTAIAECGLTRADVDITAAVDRYLSHPFDAGCEEAMGLRALVMLGYGRDGRVADQLSRLCASQLPDGGFLCLHRRAKMCYTPKSCYKANCMALLLFAECEKRGLHVPAADGLVEYFFHHDIFYKTDGSGLVLDNRAGWRSIDAFYPIEVMRVGISNIVESLSALGHGNSPKMMHAWDMLDEKRDDSGRYVLEGTLTRSYLPKEKTGCASKWVTLYALLAHKHSDRSLMHCEDHEAGAHCGTLSSKK